MRKRLTIASFLSMFFLGVGISVIGAAAPAIGLGPEQIGVLQAVQGLGSMAAVLVVGYYADIYSKPRILVAGSVLLSLSFGLFFAWPLFALNAVLIGLIGVAMGTFEASTDALLFELHTQRRGLVVNVNHLFVTIGALLITAYLTWLQLEWRRSMVQAAIGVALVAVLYLFSSGRRTTGGRAQPLRQRLAVLGTDRKITTMFAAITCAAGMEIASMGLIPTYLIQLRGFDPIPANVGLLVFIGGIATGRLFVGYLTSDRRIRQSIAVLFATASVAMSVLYFVDIGPWVVAALFVAGNAISALVPLVITYAGLLHPEMAGTAMGAVKVGLPLGGIAVPFLISLLARMVGFAAALALIPLAGAVGLLLAVSAGAVRDTSFDDRR